jgi:hypothetical protein
MSSLQQNWRKGQNTFCLEVRGFGGRGREQRAGGRNDPNNVCTYKYMNKEKKVERARLNIVLCITTIICLK